MPGQLLQAEKASKTGKTLEKLIIAGFLGGFIVNCNPKAKNQSKIQIQTVK